MPTAPDTWTPTPTITNYVLDPSFEGTSPPLNGWSSSTLYYDKTNVLQSFDQSGAAARAGSKSLRMVCGTSGSTVSNWVSIDNVFTTNKIVIYAKTTAATAKQVGIIIKPIQADGTVVPAAVMGAAVGASGNAGTTTWTKFIVDKPTWTTATYPTMTGLRMYLTVGGPYAGITAGDEVLWDTFSDNGITTYFDGSSGTGTPSWDGEFEYAWTGTPHASASTRTLTRKVHYPSVITLGTPFTVEGTGYPAGALIDVLEGTWWEITESTVADSSGNWSVTMTIPPNTDENIGPVAGSGHMVVAPTVGGVSGSYVFTNLPTPMTYLDPPGGPEARVFIDGTATVVTEIRISSGGTTTAITELGT